MDAAKSVGNAPNSRRPDCSIEAERRAQGYRHIAGVDEAGRGALAGPVVAAAVELPVGWVPNGLDDSKKLGPAQREKLYLEIEERAAIGVGFADIAEIEHLNILHAAMLAMRRAAENLNADVGLLLIDGNRVPEGLAVPAEPVVGGDGKSASIAAASVVAKVVRDKLMSELSIEHPGYGWSKNKGYGTKQHIRAIQENGPTVQHRLLFAPVRFAQTLFSAGNEQQPSE